MNLLQQQVRHCQFGTGIVTEQTEKTLTVQFEAAEKIFLFPSAFAKFLTLTDSEQDAAMRAYLAQLQQQAQERQAQAEQAERERIAALRIAALAAKRSGGKKRPAAKRKSSAR